MVQQIRKFEGIWIPANIWLSEELTLQEKVFLVEIKSLDNEQGCFASNDHFAKMFQLSKSRCSEVINSLKAKNLVHVELTYKEGKKQIDRRTMRINYRHEVFTGIRKVEEGIREVDGGIRKVEEPPSGKEIDKEYIINNTINNNDDDNKAAPVKSESQIDTSALTKPVKSEKAIIEKQNPFEFYQVNGFGSLSSMSQHKIGNWIDDLSEELVVLAMQKAIENNAIRWTYAETILKDWFSKNIRTLEQVEALDAQRQANMNRKSNYQANNNPVTPPNYNYEVKPNESTRNNESDNDPFRNVQLFK